MKKFRMWIKKHRMQTVLILLFFILFVLAGFFIPIASEVTGGCYDGPVVRHDLILGGSIEQQKEGNKIYNITDEVESIQGASITGGKCQKHLLYVF